MSQQQAKHSHNELFLQKTVILPGRTSCIGCYIRIFTRSLYIYVCILWYYALSFYCMYFIVLNSQTALYACSYYGLHVSNLIKETTYLLTYLLTYYTDQARSRKQHCVTLKRPRFGFCFPASIFRAVDLPIPLVPTRPRTSPGRGVGNR